MIIIKKKEKPIFPLDLNIIVADIEKYENEFNTAMRKKRKKGWLKPFLIGCPILIGIIILIFTIFPITFLFANFPTIFAIGTIILSLVTIGVFTIDMFKDETNSTRLENVDTNIIKINEEKGVEEILEQHKSIQVEDYYTEEYKEFLDYLKNEQVNLNNTGNEVPLNIVENDEEDFLDKEEAITQIADAIETYYSCYKLPPLTISNKEWDILFDTTYELFQEKGLENKFYELMNHVVKMTLAKSIAYENSKVDVMAFINNLSHIENHGLKKTEVDDLKKIIIAKLPNSGIITFPNKQQKKELKHQI